MQLAGVGSKADNNGTRARRLSESPEGVDSPSRPKEMEALIEDPSPAAEALMRTVRGLAGRRTMIVVSHDLELARFADRVLVLAEGRVQALWPPPELDATAARAAQRA